MDQFQICPTCNTQTSQNSFFCPNCGKSLKEKPITLTLSRQILVYFVSFFLPPLGLFPALKYIKQSGTVRTVGIIAIILTVISIGISIIAVIQFVSIYLKIINSLSFPTGDYTNLLQ